MNYQTYTPHQQLALFIKCFWSLEVPALPDAEKQRIVPDGCMEMIFHYGDLFRQYLPDGSFIIQPKCFVFGQITNLLEIEPTGNTVILAARFHPDGFIPFTSYPLYEMENKAVPLNILFGNEGIELEQQVLKDIGNEERIKYIEEFLIKKLHTAETIDLLTKSSIEVLLKSRGQLSMNDLAEQLNISRRQLERKFSSAIGMSPKQLAKIIRLQATLQMLQQKQFTSLTSLAYENGYFDQTHFIKDFK